MSIDVLTYIAWFSYWCGDYLILWGSIRRWSWLFRCNFHSCDGLFILRFICDDCLQVWGFWSFPAGYMSCVFLQCVLLLTSSVCGLLCCCRWGIGCVCCMTSLLFVWMAFHPSAFWYVGIAGIAIFRVLSFSIFSLGWFEKIVILKI